MAWNTTVKVDPKNEIEVAPGDVLFKFEGTLLTRRSIAIFDLGGVLINFDPRLLYRKLLPNEEAVEKFLGNICTLEWSAPHDTGSSLGDSIAELVHRRQRRRCAPARDSWRPLRRGG